MLEELHVRNLGVVNDAQLILGPGMTAITGETGAGKTLLTEAIRLLAGGKAEASMVGPVAKEARIDGRFSHDPAIIDLREKDTNEDETAESDELIISRVIPADGRGRTYLNGTMATRSEATDASENLIELHGQHGHQTLLTPAAQRRALDAFAAIDLHPLNDLRKERQQVEREIASLGGDPRTRARELDLLRFQLDEIEDANLQDANEDQTLLERETTMADAAAHREAASDFHEAISGDSGAIQNVAAALKAAANRPPLAQLSQRLAALNAELEDLSLESAQLMSVLVDDPEGLAAVQERRALLKALGRKYGATVADIISYRDDLRSRIDDIERHDEVVETLMGRREDLDKKISVEAARVGKLRRKAAPDLSKEVAARLHDLALPHAVFEILFGDDPGADDVTFLLGPNPGIAPLPIAKAASGGELARSMLALRLALMNAHSSDHLDAETLIFDEVDAGIGGEAAVAVGKALAMVARATPRTQVLVVTHLAQVAAFATQQVNVQKEQDKNSTKSRIRVLEPADREIELARMLSGIPESESGVLHARELLAEAARLATPTKESGATPSAAKPAAKKAAPRKAKPKATAS